MRWTNSLMNEIFSQGLGSLHAVSTAQKIIRVVLEWKQTIPCKTCVRQASVNLLCNHYTWTDIGDEILLSGVPDYFDRNKISSGGDLSHYSSASLY